MSETTPRLSAAELSRKLELEIPADQRKALTDMAAMVPELHRELKRARQAFDFSLKATAGPLAFAKAKVQELDGLLARNEQQADAPEYAYFKQTLVLAKRLFEANQAMIEVQNKYDERNLAIATQTLDVLADAKDDPVAWTNLVETGVLGPKLQFKLPLEDLRYLEARARMNLYLGLHRWMACADGIDAILRLTMNERAIECRDEAEEQGRAGIAAAMKAASAGNRDLQILLGQLGSELSAAWAYFTWGSNELKAIQGLPDDEKLLALDDPEWAKLNGKTIVLATLLDKLAPFPEIAQYFPENAPPEIPYEQLEWIEEAPGAGRAAGTARLGTDGLQRTGTGGMQGKTGRLPPR